MYRIKLYHTIFDKENDNVLLFDSKEELKEYFDNQDFQLFEDINFIANNLIETNICLTIDTEESIPLIKILNYNYCIVENMENEEDTLFFFINESKQDSANQIILSLQLDPFNSYYYDIRNLRGLVNRTHLDRFVKRDENYVFNFAEASPLFEREPIQNLSKRPTYKSKLVPILAGEGTDFDNWINENVDHWVYYYISGGKEYKAYKSYGESEIEPKTFLDNIKFTFNSGFGLDGAVVVLVAPVYKTDKRFSIRGEVDSTGTSHTYFSWEESSIKEFLKNNDGFANVYAIKHSILPPFYATNVLSQKTEVLSNGNLRYNATMPGSSGDAYISGTTGFDYILDYCVGFAKSSGGFGTEPSAFGFVERQYVEKYLTLKPNYRGKLSPELYKNTFSIDELIYNGNLEPKIYNEDYSTYRLYIGGQSKELSISKTSNQPKFRYFEILSPDITKAFLTFDANESYSPYASVFNDVTVKDFTGFMISIDLSMWFSKDGLDNWLATNKNNLQIFANNQKSEANQTLTSGILGLVSGVAGYGGLQSQPNSHKGTGTGGLFGSIFGTMASGINLMIKQNIERENFSLTLDNMRNAPEELSALNSNLVLISNVDEFGIYIEIQEPLSFERGKVVDYLKLFGYSYNKIGDVRDFNKTRRYYNYVQALIFEIDCEIAEQVKDYLKSIFAKGIRFWHADTFQSIDFTLNNIERSIYNG